MPCRTCGVEFGETHEELAVMNRRLAALDAKMDRMAEMVASIDQKWWRSPSFEGDTGDMTDVEVSLRWEGHVKAGPQG